MAESSSSVESVVFVCKEEAERLRHLVGDLERAEPRHIEGVLRDIAKCADTLSAALTRVSAYVDHLEVEDPCGPKEAPQRDDHGLLEIATRLRVGAKFGICAACGGVLDHGVRDLPPTEDKALA